jgi:plasmid replication initiation protein
MSNITNYKVVHSNHLIEASYDLLLEEKRLLVASIAKIDSRGKVPDKITISAREYSDTFPVQIDSAYSQMKSASDRLFEREIRIKNGNKHERLRWVQKSTYHEKEGKVSLFFTDTIKEYLGEIKGNYTEYLLENISDLKSLYSIRLYELLTQKQYSNQRWILIKDFREMFVLNDKYKKFSDLRKFIINKAVEEVNAKTNLQVTWNPEKEGKTIVKLWFNFIEKPQKSFDF